MSAALDEAALPPEDEAGADDEAAAEDGAAAGAGAGSEGEAPWYEEGLRFTCTACGTCCKGPDPGYVLMSPAESERLAAHLGMELQAFGRRYLRRLSTGEVSLVELRNADCIFWADDVGCTVYAARPDQCRQFPFWPENLTSRTAWDVPAAFCPGMNTGRLYTRPEIERISGGLRGTRSGRRRALRGGRGRRLPGAK